MSAYLNTSQTILRPRAQVLVNGSVILDQIKWSVTSNNNYSADRFRMTVIAESSSQYGTAWWGSQDSILIEIKVGFLQSGDPESKQPAWTSIFQGQVDDMSNHPETSEIEVNGRDLSARFIDAKTHDAYKNQTSSQVVQTLAAAHGMSANVTPTTTLIGAYYAADHDKITGDSMHRDSTEWQLMVRLARQEGYDLWVSGTTVNFQPLKSKSATPYLVALSTNPKTGALECNCASDIRLDRDLTKSRDIKVTVKSYNSRQKTSFVVSAGGGASGAGGSGKGTKGSPGTSAQEFTYVIPGLTQAEAQKRANAELDYLTKLERRISYSQPGTLDYNVRDNLLVTGTGSTWDGPYFVNEMTRSMSFGGSFRQSVTAKNHDTRQQTSD